MTTVAEVPPPRVEVHAPARGTVLEVARGGVPGGRPVVLHHGLVGGALVPADWHALAVAHDVELVAAARPGYGRSDPVDMGSVAAWPELLGPVLDHLGLTSGIGALGVSAGAAYALALAAGLPGRVERVVVLSGVAHVADPEVLALYSEEAQEAYARYAVVPLEEIAEEMHAALGPLVGALAAGADDAADWAAALTATLAHGGLGPAREARLQIRPWGFALDQVRQPVRLWHAPDDDEVPHAAAAATADALPRGELVTAGAGHVPGPEVERAALAWLAAS